MQGARNRRAAAKRLLLAATSVAVFTPIASAATTGFNRSPGGTYDYNDPANWVGGNINNTWHSSLSVADDQTITFAADTTLSGALTIDYTASSNFSAFLNFDAADSTPRTLTLGGNVTFTPSFDQTLVFGHANVNIPQSLTVNLGGAERTFSNEQGDAIVFDSALTGGGVRFTGSGSLTFGGRTSIDSLTMAGAAMGFVSVVTLASTFLVTSGTTTFHNNLATTTGIHLSGGSLIFSNLQNSYTMSYTGGTTVSGGILHVLSGISLGANVTGNNLVIGGGIANLYSAVALGSNQAVTIGSTATSLGVLGLGYNAAPPALIVGASDEFVLGTNTNYSVALNLATIGNGQGFLGASATGGTYSAATLGVGVDGVYRIGGGGVAGGTNHLTITSGVLNAGNVTVNSFKTNGGNDVVLRGANLTSGIVSLNGGSLRLGGSSGSLANASIVAERASLYFAANGLGETGAVRVNQLTLSSSGLLVQSNFNVNTNETITGSVLVRSSSVTLPSIDLSGVANAAHFTRLDIGGAMTRENGTVVVLSGDGLGGAATSRGTSHIFTGTKPTLVGGDGGAGSSSISILPWAIGNIKQLSEGSTFVTYDDANGFRPLRLTEYASAFGAATANVRITSSTNVAAATTANALLASAAVTGQTVTVTSGAVFLSGASAAVAGLDFGSAQGVIGFNAGLNLRTSAHFAGAGGLVLYQLGSDTVQLDLEQASTYSGDTYLYGNVGLWSSSVIGSTSTGRAGRLFAHGKLELRTAETFDSLSGTAQVNKSATGNHTLTLGDGDASGDFAGSFIDTGNLSIIKIGAGIQRFSGAASTYSGATTIRGGVLEVAVLADGGQASSIGDSSSAASNLVIANGTLRYTGTGDTTNRLFMIGESGVASGTIDASGSGALVFSNTGGIAYNNVITANPRNRTLVLTGSNTGANTLASVVGQNGFILNSTGADVNLVKSGAGRWVLSNANTYRGTTSINAGTLQVSAGGALGATASADVYVADGAVLQLDGITAIDDSADLVLADGSTVILNGAGSESVNFLWLNGVMQSAGTYGATGSGAMFVNDDYFRGDGTITAVPEPAGLGLLAVAGAGLLRRRRWPGKRRRDAAADVSV